MTIKKFEIDKGVYVFEESNLTAQFHAHPVLELVIARQGSFSVSTKGKSLEGIQCCLIMPHEVHAFEGKKCDATFIFIEGSSTNFKEIIWTFGVSNANDGIIEIKEKFKHRIEEVVFETLK